MPRHNQRGIALVTVLWVALFVSVILAGMLSITRIEAKSVQAETELLRREKATKGALLIAWTRLSDTSRNRQQVSLPLEIKIGDYDVRVSLSEEMKKIDLNLASEQDIATAFIAKGLEQEMATQQAAQIADWRDKDELARVNGAESREYLAVNSDNKFSADRHFLSLNELQHVLDMEETLISCMLDRFTISGSRLVSSSSGAASRGARPSGRMTLKAKIKNEEVSAFNIEQIFQSGQTYANHVSEPYSNASVNECNG